MNVRELLSHLQGVQPTHGGWSARCPAQEDRKPSLSIAEKDGKLLLHCHVGCTTEAILAASGLVMADLFTGSRSGGTGKRIVAEYPYTDENGNLLFQVVRLEPKSFLQRHADGKGGWIWNLKGVRRVLYHLPEVHKAGSVLIVEGEKDANTARALGLTATCNPHGAGKWRREYSEFLRGKRIAIIADADAPGLAHARDVARSSVGVAASVKLIEVLPQAKDLTEWVELGGTREALLKLIARSPELAAADVAKWTQPKAASGFTLNRLADLLARPDTPVDYILENRLVAGTASAVVAKPKVGKSTFARNLCLAVARGDDFLGLKTKKGECIYLALEEREDDIRNDFRAMGANGSEPIVVHAASAPAEGIGAACQLIHQRRAALVVIDPLFRLARVKR